MFCLNQRKNACARIVNGVEHHLVPVFLSHGIISNSRFPTLILPPYEMQTDFDLRLVKLTVRSKGIKAQVISRHTCNPSRSWG